MSKVTAVEWLVQEIEKQYPQIDISWKENLINQAKAMEKEQIIKAAILSHFEGARQSAKTSEEYIKYGEQYYNETYDK